MDTNSAYAPQDLLQWYTAAESDPDDGVAGQPERTDLQKGLAVGC